MRALTEKFVPSPSSTNFLRSEENGVFLVYFSLLVVAVLGIGSFAVDLGLGFSEMRRMHNATDNAVLAGMYELVERRSEANTTAKRDAVLNVATAILQANGVDMAELAAGAGTGMQLGVWSPATRTFAPTNDISIVNAMRIGARRNVSTVLAAMFGQDTLRPMVESIAARGFPISDVCLVPFGIIDDLIFGLNPGDIITVNDDATSAGNWGKLHLDPDRNMSANPEFIDAFLNGICNVRTNVGQQVNSATGFAGLERAVDQRMAANPVITVAIVDQFFNGKKPVTIMGFADVEIISQERRGRNWEADFRFLEAVGGDGITGPGAPVFNQSVMLVQ